MGSKKKKHKKVIRQKENLEEAVIYARWYIEMLGNWNEFMVNRTNWIFTASALEIGLIVNQYSNIVNGKFSIFGIHSECAYNFEKFLLLTSIVFLAISCLASIRPSMSRKFYLPDFDDIRNGMLKNLEGFRELEERQLFGINIKDGTLIEELMEENRFRSKWLNGTGICFLIAQIPLIVIAGIHVLS
jgi:hypothetical protein